MAISGPSSYVQTVEEFITHWTMADGTLGAGSEIVLADGANLALLTSKKDELLAKRADLQSKLMLLEVARGDIDVRKQTLLDLFKKFTGRVRALAAGSKWERALPATPGARDSEAGFTDPLDKAASLWSMVNNDPAYAEIVIQGVTQAQFAAQFADLRAAYVARTNAKTVVQVTREERNDLQDEIYECLKKYRQVLPSHFDASHALVESLPRLTPTSGATPEAVMATGQWDELGMQARITYTPSTAPDFAAYELRYTPGPFYSGEDDIVIGQNSDINSLEFVTATGLATPGVTASYKVYVKTTNGHEKGSDAVVVTRPVQFPLPPAP